MHLEPLRGKHERVAREYLGKPPDERPRGLVLSGAVRAGKTVVQSAINLGVAAEMPASWSMAIFAATRETAARNLIEPYFRPMLGKYLKERQGYIQFWNRKCWIIGCDNILAIDRIKGMTLGFALLDEITTFPKEVYAMIMTRLSDDAAAWVGTTNTDSPFHWFYEDVIKKEAAQIEHFTIDDNEFLSDRYKQGVKDDMKLLGQTYYDRYILGKWVAAEGRIFEIGPEQLLTEVSNKHRRATGVIGVDYGTTSPTAAVAISCGNDEMIVLDEFYYNPKEEQRKLTDYEQAVKLIEWAQSTGLGQFPPWYVDPSATSLKEQLRLLGQTVYDQDDLRDVKRGIGVVASLLNLGKLHFIDQNTKELQKEIDGYVWAEPSKKMSDTSPQLDKPVKRNDHLCDALRYAVYSGTARTFWYWWLSDILKEKLGI